MRRAVHDAAMAGRWRSGPRAARQLRRPRRVANAVERLGHRLYRSPEEGARALRDMLGGGGHGRALLHAKSMAGGASGRHFKEVVEERAAELVDQLAVWGRS